MHEDVALLTNIDAKVNMELVCVGLWLGVSSSGLLFTPYPTTGSDIVSLAC